MDGVILLKRCVTDVERIVLRGSKISLHINRIICNGFSRKGREGSTQPEGPGEEGFLELVGYTEVPRVDRKVITCCAYGICIIIKGYIIYKDREVTVDII